MNRTRNRVGPVSNHAQLTNKERVVRAILAYGKEHKKFTYLEIYEYLQQTDSRVVRCMDRDSISKLIYTTGYTDRVGKKLIPKSTPRSGSNYQNLYSLKEGIQNE